MDCTYYKSRKSDWGYTGGADATQWCSHPESTGSLKCDTDKCPKFEPFCNVCGTDEGEIRKSVKRDDGSFACAYCEGCEHPGRYGCGACSGCEAYADHTFDLMREDGFDGEQI